MGAGKILVIIGALLTLVSTFFLTLVPFTSGLGFILNLPDILGQGGMFGVYVLAMGSEMIVYILTIVYIVFLVSGVLQLVGLANRVVAIIGSVLPIVISVLIILAILVPLPTLGQYSILFLHADIVPGILPFDLYLGGGHIFRYIYLISWWRFRICWRNIRHKRLLNLIYFFFFPYLILNFFKSSGVLILINESKSSSNSLINFSIEK